jgi:hypothetical protein
VVWSRSPGGGVLTLLHAWLLFPLVLLLVCGGWGLLVDALADSRLPGALIVPLGAATVIVIAGILTAFDATAPAATPVVAAGALAGLGWRWRTKRVALWPLLAAIGVLLSYGAPVLLSGQATFLGYLRLDDTATWLGLTDQIMSHGRSLGSLPSSTYQLEMHSYLTSGYPVGAFLILGVGRGLARMDVAWVFQPYLACCGAAVALSMYSLTERLVASPRLRALIAFIGAQSALLYGYSLWGGIKELTVAFLLVLAVALAALMSRRRAPRPREMLAPAVAIAALIDAFGPGVAVWVLPLLGVGVLAALWRARFVHAIRAVLVRVVSLGALVTALALPAWLVLAASFSYEASYASQTSSSTPGEALGNLLHPLSVFQLAGVWPVGDFRLTPSTLPTALFIAVIAFATAIALWSSVRRGLAGVAAYVGLALLGCGVISLLGGTPWVVGKALAIASPAIPLAALTGGALLSSRTRVGGGLVLAVIAGGVLWSNALAYHDVLLAPRARLVELQHIGALVAGKGPTFVNDYEIYADRHFLREGAPVEPAEYRSVLLPLRNGVLLTKSAWADLDSFAPSTLEPYRSIVVQRSPVESRPPSIYRRVWQGRYYELWQRPAHPSTRIIEQVPFGESNTLPYCGAAESGPFAPECSVDPVAIPPCAQIQALARVALRSHAQLVAYQRPEPIVARGDQTLWPGMWVHDPQARTLTATVPGEAISHIALDIDENYELWLGGSFARGFEVSVDGRDVGRVKDEVSAVEGYVHVANLPLVAGVHTFGLTYPHADLTPGSGDDSSTYLSAIVLEPQQGPSSELLDVSPQHAAGLCGRPLDWVEIVAAR